MQNEIKIVYQHYIPESFISDFRESKIDSVLQTKVEIEQIDQTRYSSFNGPEISDIIIYIQQHSTEIIAGVFITTLYDTLKASLVTLWSRLSEYSDKQLKDAGKEVNQPKQITLYLKNKNREVEICFKGDVNQEIANNIIGDSFTFINSEKATDAFANPDNIEEPKAARPKIRLLYNKETKSWEPENFGDYRREMEELDKLMKSKFTS